MAGKLRFYEDVSGSRTQLLMPGYFAVAAEIHEQRGEQAIALADIKAAQTLGKDVRSDAFAREASIWRGIESFKKAEDALLEARRRGAPAYRFRLNKRDAPDVLDMSVVLDDRCRCPRLKGPALQPG